MWKRTHNDRTRGLLLTGLKAAGSAAVAIAVASAIHLQFSATAGIIAILSLMGTKRETMKVALGRLMAYGSALLIAFVCFSLFGDGLLAFGIYLFVFASLCYACSWGYATAMISVLISHFMGTGGMTWTQVGNESLLFLIGTTCGILTNLHLHPDERRLDALLRQADEQMRAALRALAEGADARNPLILLGETLSQADECAAKNAENSLTDAPKREIHYINMRRQQRRILLQVTKDAQKVQGHPPQEAEVRALIDRILPSMTVKTTAHRCCPHCMACWQRCSVSRFPQRVASSRIGRCCMCYCGAWRIFCCSNASSTKHMVTK